MRRPHLMRRLLLTTTAVITCMMLAPPVEARPASRHAGIDAGFEADDGAGDQLIAVAQAAPAENDEEDDGEEDEEGDEEDDEDVEDGGDDPGQGDVQDDENTTADPDSGPATDDEGDIAVDGDEEDDGDEDEEEDDSFPAIPGTLNATINGTATFQAGIMGDRTSGVQFRNETDIELNVRGKSDNGLLYGLKVLFQSLFDYLASVSI
jgi:hypothetical protein